MTTLTSLQRKYLRVLAHHLDPIVLVGKNGVSDQLIAAVAEALEAQELIKVRFNDHKAEKKELTAEIAARTDSAVAGVIGHVAILYRPQPDEEKRAIALPSA